MGNYEKVYAHYQERFFEMDHEKASEKLRLEYDDNNIYIPFFSRPVVLSRRTAEMNSPAYPEGVPTTHRLLVMHHLYFHEPDAVNSTEMVPFHELRECAHFEPAFRRTAVTPLAKYFDGKLERLRERALRLGGTIESAGDCGFTLRAFPLVPLRFIFWDGDDEFPANVNILFDKNLSQFIHPESIPVLGEVGAALLMEP